MINRFDRKYKPIIHNFTALFTVQIFSYLFPFITIPYLTLKLGIIAFGKYGLYLAVISFVDSLVSYGFRVSATNQIAQNSEDVSSISSIATSVFIAKIGIVLAILFLLFISFQIDLIRSEIRFYLIGIGFIVGNLLLPVWLYQGMQKMVYITYSSVLAKCIFTALIFWRVKSSEDLFWVVGAHSFAYFVSGVLAFVASIKLFKLRLRWPGIGEVRDQMSIGLSVFLAQLSVSLYSNLNLIVFGTFASDISLGIYAITEKVYKLGITIAAPFNRAIFPHLAKLRNDSKSGYTVELSKLVKPLSLVFAILSITVFLFAPEIIGFLMEHSVNHEVAISSLRILSVGICVAPYGGLFTYALVIQGEDKTLLRLVLLIVGINWVLFYPLTKVYDLLGLSVLTVFISFCVATLKGIAVFNRLK
jgi:PST family polysaccharide transporter